MKYVFAFNHAQLMTLSTEELNEYQATALTNQVRSSLKKISVSATEQEFAGLMYKIHSFLEGTFQDKTYQSLRDLCDTQDRFEKMIAILQDAFIDSEFLNDIEEECLNHHYNKPLKK